MSLINWSLIKKKCMLEIKHSVYLHKGQRHEELAPHQDQPSWPDVVPHQRGKDARNQTCWLSHCQRVRNAYGWSRAALSHPKYEPTGSSRDWLRRTRKVAVLVVLRRGTMLRRRREVERWRRIPWGDCVECSPMVQRRCRRYSASFPRQPTEPRWSFWTLCRWFWTILEMWWWWSDGFIAIHT